MRHNNWECPKCRNREFEQGQFGATGGAFTKFFNIQNKKFTTLSCTRCRYTEIYKAETSTIGNLLDFFGNLSRPYGRMELVILAYVN